MHVERILAADLTSAHRQPKQYHSYKHSTRQIPQGSHLIHPGAHEGHYVWRTASTHDLYLRKEEANIGRQVLYVPWLQELHCNSVCFIKNRLVNLVHPQTCWVDSQDKLTKIVWQLA